MTSLACSSSFLGRCSTESYPEKLLIAYLSGMISRKSRDITIEYTESFLISPYIGWIYGKLLYFVSYRVGIEKVSVESIVVPLKLLLGAVTEGLVVGRCSKSLLRRLKLDHNCSKE